VHVERAGSRLRLRVENDVDPDGADGTNAAAGGGIGLANVRARLLAEYGIEASVHAARVDNIFRVELALPADTGE